MNKLLAIYARQSKDREASGSIDDQIAHGITMANDLQIPYQTYIDRGKSAYRDNFENRPAFQELLDNVKEGRITDVFVYDSSRLVRDDMANYQIIQTFKQRGITVHTVIEGKTDYTDPMQVFFTNIRAYMNMSVVRQSTEKIKSSLLNRVIQGKAHTGVIKPYGYLADDHKMLAIDPNEAAVVESIFNMSLLGYGSTLIARKLNEQAIPTKTKNLILAKKLGKPKKSKFNEKNYAGFQPWKAPVVLGILKNPLYKGKRFYKGQFYDVPNIIEPTMWEEVQVKIQENRNAPSPSKHQYLLNDMLFCARCGSKFCGRTRPSKKDHYYYCSSKVKNIERCGIRSINIDAIESLVWSIVSNSDLIIKKANDEVDKLKSVDAVELLSIEKRTMSTKLKDLEDGKAHLLSLISSNYLTLEDAKNQLNKNQQAKEQISEKIRSINQKLNSVIQITKNINYAQAFIKDWENLALTEDFELKRSIVRLFLNRIDIGFNDATQIFTISLDIKIPNEQKLLIYQLNKGGNFVDSKTTSTISDSSNSEMV